MVYLKRMQTAGLLTLGEFVQEAFKLMKQARAGAGAAGDDDVQIVAHARLYRWYSENKNEQFNLHMWWKGNYGEFPA